MCANVCKCVHTLFLKPNQICFVYLNRANSQGAMNKITKLTSSKIPARGN